MKYIDAEKLIADIQFLIDSGYDNLQGNLYHILSLIESLQQEQSEVDLDLEKEIDEKYRNDNDTLKNREQYARLARHFAEWGVTHLNARKEE